jgi:hypothetical protein
VRFTLNRRLALVSLAVAGAATAAVSPFAASGDPTQRLYVGLSLHLTGPNTSAGTFVASGAVADSGATDVPDLTIGRAGPADAGRLSGTETFTGQSGAIVTRFVGDAFPLSSPHEVGIGRIDIVSGTGAYAGIRGHGTFEIVVDATTNQLIGTVIAGVER